MAQPLMAALRTNQNPGEVEVVSYAPQHIVMKATANAPSVLVLNDQYDPNWRVWVDGKPAELLGCNFIVRGVFLDRAGEHRVEFRYQPPLIGLCISLASLAVALGLLGYVYLLGRTADC
jgi:hypothetical protein